MIKQTPDQMGEYSSRLKYRLDEAARLEYARSEGLQEGERRGRLEGRVTTLQQLLGIAESTPDELSQLDETQLTEMAERLQQELRARGN